MVTRSLFLANLLCHYTCTINTLSASARRDLTSPWCPQAMDAALKQVKAIAPQMSALFLSVDEDAGKIVCLSIVSKVR